jgi:SAM-dependent methyltransferase
MPPPDCPQCRGNGRSLFSVGDLNRNVSGERYRYYRCRDCRLVYLAPLPPDLSVYYPPAYHEIPKSTDGLQHDLEREQFKVDAVNAHTKGRRLLEIGPSYGRFAFLAKSAGFDVEALEMDPSCCRFLNEVVGIRAFHTTDIIDSARRAGTYDAIAMWHSLEHLPDPWTLLDLLPARLNPGGILAIASPNPDSLQFRIFGKLWVHLDAPRHVELIPPALVTQRLLRHGMDRVHFTTADQGALDCNWLGWKESPKHFWGERKFRRYARYAGRKLIEAGKHLEKIPGLGSAYTLVFRKS